MSSTKPARPSSIFVGLLVGFFLSIGCSDSGDGDAGCVSGEQVLCPCADGSSGVQVCTADGFGPCQCGVAPDPSGTSGATGSSSGSGEETGDPPPTTTEPPDDCGNGVEDPGECPDLCPQDCDAGSDSTGVPACDAFAGLVQNVPSIWQEGATTGFAAGGLKCTSIGADHVCDYGELQTAEATGALDALGVGTTMWMHRLTPAMEGGTTYPADLGGRCADWTYGTNELADGEFVEVTAKGTVFHFDIDPFYDGIDPSHAAPDMLPCGETLRGIPCCNMACE